MANNTILNEVALNRREVTNPEWGTYVVHRATNKVASKLETLRTRTLNREMQEKEAVTDPITGKTKLVPAFLTRKVKRRILEELGEWTSEDDARLEEAQQGFLRACVALDEAGYESIDDVLGVYKELYSRMVEALGPTKAEALESELKVLFPARAADPTNLHSFPDIIEGYPDARKAVERAATSLEVRHILVEVDKYHKQYSLLLDAIQAQTNAYMERIKEISLFSDTVESRADARVSTAKIFYCVRDLNGEPVWDSIEECENDDSRKLSWLLSEVERLERVDASSEDTSSSEKFNFLSLLWAEKSDSDESPETTPSKEDGPSAEKKPMPSTEDSDTEVTN